MQRCWWPLTLHSQRAPRGFSIMKTMSIAACSILWCMDNLHLCIIVYISTALFLLLLSGFCFVLFGVYLDGFPPPHSCSASNLLIFGHFFQAFYFKELVRKEQKLHLPEDHSNRPSGSVINGINDLDFCHPRKSTQLTIMCKSSCISIYTDRWAPLAYIEWDTLHRNRLLLACMVFAE